MMNFKPGWAMTLLFLVMLPLLIALGSWQLDRAEQKRRLENAYLAKLTELPLRVTPQALSQPFQALRLAGRYRPEFFLLDNQVNDGNVGYWVYQVFNDEQQGRLLLNRGFITSQGRATLPVIDTPLGDISLTATVWPDTGLIPVWGDEAWNPGWPKVIQRADIQRMAELADAWPTELRLEPGQPGVLVAAPFATRLSADKHNGYAATWFGLAVVLTLGYCYIGMTQQRSRSSAT
jgi:surfeit locus 1 family protein